MFFPYLLTLVMLAREETAAQQRQALIKALEAVGPLVGQFNSVVTPQDRQSQRNRVFWREKSQWEWVFGTTTGLRWNLQDSNRFKTGLLTYKPDQEVFQLQLETIDGDKWLLTGKVEEDRLQLDSAVKGGLQQRLWIRVVNENRFLYTLFEREENKSRFVRVLDAGGTREGVTFATGGSGPECIVTGGKGTMQVSYQGKTYYVCCTGCKQAFEDDPEGILAEAKSRKNKK